MEILTQNPKLVAWTTTTLFTTVVAYKNPEFFLDSSTNSTGIILATIVNGLALSILHNQLERILEGEGTIKKQVETAQKTFDDAQMRLEYARNELTNASNKLQQEKEDCDQKLASIKKAVAFAEGKKDKAARAKAEAKIQEKKAAEFVEKEEKKTQELREEKTAQEELIDQKEKIYKEKKGVHLQIKAESKRLLSKVEEAETRIRDLENKRKGLERAQDSQIKIKAKASTTYDKLSKELAELRSKLLDAQETERKQESKATTYQETYKKHQTATEKAFHRYHLLKIQLEILGGPLPKEGLKKSKDFNALEKKKNKALGALEQAEEMVERNNNSYLQKVAKLETEKETIAQKSEEKKFLEQERQLVLIKIQSNQRLKKLIEEIQQLEASLSALEENICKLTQNEDIKFHPLKSSILDGSHHLTPSEKYKAHWSRLTQETTLIGKLEDAVRKRDTTKEELGAKEKERKEIERSEDLEALKKLRKNKTPPVENVSDEVKEVKRIEGQIRDVQKIITKTEEKKINLEEATLSLKHPLNIARNELNQKRRDHFEAKTELELQIKQRDLHVKERKSLEEQLAPLRASWEKEEKELKKYEENEGKAVFLYEEEKIARELIEKRIEKLEGSPENKGIVARKQTEKEEEEKKLANLSEEKYVMEEQLDAEHKKHLILKGKYQETLVSIEQTKEEMNNAYATLESHKKADKELKKRFEDQEKQLNELQIKQVVAQRASKDAEDTYRESEKEHHDLEEELSNKTGENEAYLLTFVEIEKSCEKVEKEKSDLFKEASDALTATESTYGESTLAKQELDIFQLRKKNLEADEALYQAQVEGQSEKIPLLKIDAHRKTIEMYQQAIKFLKDKVAHLDTKFQRDQTEKNKRNHDERVLELNLTKLKLGYYEKECKWKENPTETLKQDLKQLSEGKYSHQRDLILIRYAQKTEKDLRGINNKQIEERIGEVEYRNFQIEWILATIEFLIEKNSFNRATPFNAFLVKFFQDCVEFTQEIQEESREGIISTLLLRRANPSEGKETQERKRSVIEQLLEAITLDQARQSGSANLKQFLSDTLPSELKDSQYPILESRIDLCHLKETISREKNSTCVREYKEKILEKNLELTKRSLKLLDSKIHGFKEKNKIDIALTESQRRNLYFKEAGKTLAYALPFFILFGSYYFGFTQSLLQPLGGELSWPAGKLVCEITSFVYFMTSFRPDWSTESTLKM